MIRLIKKYKYDNSYDYVKLFKNKDEQESYFNEYDKIIIDEEYGYIRDGESFIVNFSHDYLVTHNVNYLIYNNGYKEMYCFIIAKEYIDDENTRLIYEIDVMNTFCFDFKLKTSFVERKKCTMSEIGDFDEGIDFGEHIIEHNYKCFDKEYKYFAMFKGFINQIPTFDEHGSIKNVITMPYGNQKPFCYIDDIQYPVFFMPMLTTYEAPKEIQVDTGGNSGTGILPMVKNSLGTYMCPTYGTITATYPYYSSGKNHSGVDIANSIGTAIYADMSGSVTVQNFGDESYGLHVRIKHVNGTTSIFAHLSNTRLQTGDYVQTGDEIGLMGSTGNSTGPHLHWEIRNANNQAVQPFPNAKVGDVIKINN